MGKATVGKGQVRPQTGQLLFELAPRLTRLENALLKELGEPLTFRQYRLLLRVSEGSSTLRELRAPSTLTLAAVSESVDNLVQRELLSRTADALDRRAVTIAITERGSAALAEAAALLDGLSAELVAGLRVDDAPGVDVMLGEITERVTDKLRTQQKRS